MAQAVECLALQALSPEFKPSIAKVNNNNNNNIWGCGSSSMGEYLPSMYKALGSIPQHY
jgi:hypothetical protein